MSITLKFSEKFKNNNVESLARVEWVTGCSILLNLKEFQNKEVFDKNIHSIYFAHDENYFHRVSEQKKYSDYKKMINDFIAVSYSNMFSGIEECGKKIKLPDMVL